jgi:SSS family solute:Na+ symporter
MEMIVKTRIVLYLRILFIALCPVFSVLQATAGEYPDAITAYLGKTPKLDGLIAKGEYDDAVKIVGVAGWKSDTPPACENSKDLSVVFYIKHDGNSLFFAFDITDDVIYGFDIDRWLPENNPEANKLSINKGWPFWGDGIELMLNSTFKWEANSRCVGDGRSWQFCCSTNKSILGGLGRGGLSSGLPLNEEVWARYENWIKNGDMEAAVRLKEKTEGRGYIIEWRINPNPCMKTDETSYVDLKKETKVGFNVEIQDLDEKEKGEGNWSSMHHIDYWSRVDSNSKTDLKSFGTLIIKPDKMKMSVQ